MLSKSKILAYRQCPKRLWLSKHRPELGVDSAKTKAAFTVGYSVGDAAQKLYGPGELLFDGDKPDFDGAIQRTAELIQSDQGTLFEATFRADSTLVMADVVKLSANGARVIEVKSATSVKDYYLEDCATQVHVMRKAGLNVSSVQVAHVNSSFVYPGDEDYRGLFKEVTIDGDIQPLAEQVPVWIKGAIKTLLGDEPDIKPGRQCTKPFECPFFDHCNPQTTDYPIENLPKLKRKQIESLTAKGIADVRDIPSDELQGPEQLRFYEAVRSGNAWRDPAATVTIKSLQYPRYYLDYETIGFAVPIWPGTQPHQQMPFQWSLHIEKAPGQLEHDAFLDLTGHNPSRDSTTALIKSLDKAGPILVYTSYEKGILSHMAKMYPDLAEPVRAVIERLVDLYPITKTGYYHRDMQGSWSIKAVLPTVAPELRYDALEEVQNGMAAQAAYLEAVHPATSAHRKQTLRDHLLEYCKLDTLAMVAIAHHLEGKG